MSKVIALNEEQRKLVEENVKLVPYLMKGKYMTQSEYCEMLSAGNLGLVKAASTYDASANTKFSSYAIKCIINEFQMRLRKVKKFSREISYDCIAKNKERDSEGTTLDNLILIDPFDMAKDLEEKETVKFLLETILNMDTLSARERRIFFYRAYGLTQCEIGKIFKLSQAQASKLGRKAAKTIADHLEQHLDHSGKIKVDVTSTQYKVHFAFEDEAECKEKYQKLMEMVTYTVGIPNFTVGHDGETITVNLDAEKEAFFEIANILPIVEDSEERKKQQAEKRRKERYKELYEFMSERETFTIEDIKKRFPEKSKATICILLKKAQAIGEVTRIKRGLYKVNKE